MKYNIFLKACTNRNLYAIKLFFGFQLKIKVTVDSFDLGDYIGSDFCMGSYLHSLAVKKRFPITINFC